MKRLSTVAFWLVLLPVVGHLSASPSQTLSPTLKKATARTRFVGTWKLLYRDTPNRAGESARTVETGRLTYDEQGNMTVQLARQGRDTLTASSDPRQLLSTYVAYWGTYAVDEVKGTITHQVEGSLSPNMIGRPSPHKYEFSSDDQHLALTSAGSTSTWERIR
jgi:YD repeat-containing protein